MTDYMVRNEQTGQFEKVTEDEVLEHILMRRYGYTVDAASEAIGDHFKRQSYGYVRTLIRAILGRA